MSRLTDRDLDQIHARCVAATPGPWRYMREVRDHTSGDSFIMTGTADARHADLYINADGAPVTHAHGEFTANARQDPPGRLDEVERLRTSPAGQKNEPQPAEGGK